MFKAFVGTLHSSEKIRRSFHYQYANSSYANKEIPERYNGNLKV